MPRFDRDSRATNTLVLNLVALEVAHRARRLLSDAGIPVLFLKGIAYLGALNRDLGQRAMSDIDLMVPPSQGGAAVEVLTAQGFELVPAPDGREYSYTHDYHRPLIYPDLIPTHLEVHVGFCQPGRYPIDYPGIWQRQVERVVDGRPTPMLSAEDAVLHLVLHDSKEWFALSASRRVSDLNRMIEVWSPDWSEIVARALAWHIATPAFVTLEMARRGGVPVPAEVIHDLAPSSLRTSIIEQVLDLQGGQPRVDVRRRILQLAITCATDEPGQLIRFLPTYAARRALDLVWKKLPAS